jgi:hypothetical protein
VVASVVGLLVAIGVVVAVVALASSPKAMPTGPLSSAEVMRAVRGFATAYGEKNPRALAGVLAPGVERVSPTAVEHGRVAVLVEYKAQFKAEPIRAYELSDTSIVPGSVGRVSGRYTVLQRGRAAITGTVAFGIERVDGQPEIGLIATQ